MFKQKSLALLLSGALITSMIGLTINVNAKEKLNNTKNQPIASISDSDEIVSGHIYKIINKNSSKVVDVEGSSKDKGANIHQWEWKAGNNQKWKIELVDGGYYKISNLNSGKTLDVEDKSKDNGAKVHQWDWKNEDNQKWKIVSNGDDTFRFENKNSSKVFDVSGGSTDNGANIHQWQWKNGDNQKWILKDITAGSGLYKIVNRNSGLIMDVSGQSKDNGAIVHQWSWLEQANQRWSLDLLDDSYYKITNQNSGKVLDVKDSSKDNGADICQWDWNGGDNQRWKMISNNDGTVSFQNKNSGKFFDVADKSSDEGANIHQWEWNNGENQKWNIIELDIDKTDNCRNIKLDDVTQTFNNIKTNGTVFNMGAVLSMPGDIIHNHCQGIARYKDQILVSQNVTPGVDVYSISNTIQLEKRIKFSTNLKHYGGCQVIGNYLLVGIEGDNNSVVCFYDLRTNRELTSLQIMRNTGKAGGIGITNFTRDGKEYWCLSVLDNGIVDFYEADKELNDPSCQFKLVSSGLNINSIKGYSDYSELCLLTDKNQKLYIMGFRTKNLGTSNDDYIDLYSLDKFEGNVIKCSYMNSKHVVSHGNPIGETGPHFRYTGGLNIVSEKELNVLTSVRLPSSSAYNINVFSAGSGL